MYVLYIYTSVHWDLKQGHNDIKMSSLITVTLSYNNEDELLQPSEIWVVNMTLHVT